MKALHRRLAAHMLELYVEGKVSRGCSDWLWPDWFPVEERGPFAYAMEMANSGNESDATEGAAVYGASIYGPADFSVALHCIRLLRAGSEE